MSDKCRCPCHKEAGKLACVDGVCACPCHFFEKWNGLAWIHTGFDRTAPGVGFTSVRFGKP